PLELQTTFASGVCKSCDATVVLVACAVEDDGFDASFLGARSNECANLGCLSLLVAFQCAHVSFHGGSCSQGVASQVVDDLDVHVAGGAVDNQAWSLWGTTQGLTDAEVATSTCFATSGGDVLTDWGALCVFSVCHCLLTRIFDLVKDLLDSLTDALDTVMDVCQNMSGIV